MREHARLSASGADRWLNCPASIAMEEHIPNRSSRFAEHGTAAHELAERCLQEQLKAEFFLGYTFNGFKVDPEMVRGVQVYLDYVKHTEGDMFIEKRVDFSPWVPGGFGTCDCLIVTGNMVHVIDLKFGKGVRVDAENNSQGMLYALGALNELNATSHKIEVFKIAIVQPRLNHLSEFEITKDDLLEWAKIVKVKAARCFQDEPLFNPGVKQCRFCKAKTRCRALAEHVIQTSLK